MRHIIIALTLSLVAGSAGAATICPLKTPGSTADVIVFNSKEAFDACVAEKQANGAPGGICLRAVAAAVPSGTRAQYLGSAGITFTKVRVLQGVSAGVEGIVPMDACKF